MINNFLFVTGSTPTGSFIEVIDSGSLGSGTGNIPASSYSTTLNNVLADDLFLVIGCGTFKRISSQPLDTNPDNTFFLPLQFSTSAGFTPLLGASGKPINDADTKATSFAQYKIVTEEEENNGIAINVEPRSEADTTGFLNDEVDLQVAVYNYFVLRGVNPSDPVSTIVSSSNNDIGDIELEDNQSVIYSLYYMSGSGTPDPITPLVDLNGSAPPSNFSSSIAGGVTRQFNFIAVGNVQCLVNSAFIRFDEANTFNPDPFAFSNGHDEGKSTTAIVLNNFLDGNGPFRTHLMPTSSFEFNTTTGEATWNPPSAGENAFYDNYGIDNLKFYFKFAKTDEFTPITDTTGSGYQDPVLVGSSTLISFLQNGFTSTFNTKGYYTGYYVAVDSLGNESEPTDQVDVYQLTAGVEPAPEIISFNSQTFGFNGSGVTNNISTDTVEVDDLIVAFAYQASGNNPSLDNLTLTDGQNGDPFNTLTVGGIDASPNTDRFKAFFKFVSASSLSNDQMTLSISSNGNINTGDATFEAIAIRGVNTTYPFNMFVNDSGTSVVSGENIDFPSITGVDGESPNSLILSIAGVRRGGSDPTPGIQGGVSSELQLLTDPPEKVINNSTALISAGYKQEDSNTNVNVNSIGYNINNNQEGRSVALVLFINPIGFVPTPSQQTPSPLTPPQLDFNIENTTVQIDGAS